MHLPRICCEGTNCHVEPCMLWQRDGQHHKDGIIDEHL